MVLDTALLTVETTVEGQLSLARNEGICEQVRMVTIGSAWAASLTNAYGHCGKQGRGGQTPERLPWIGDADQTMGSTAARSRPIANSNSSNWGT
jgi:hypothetical protein